SFSVHSSALSTPSLTVGLLLQTPARSRSRYCLASRLGLGRRRSRRGLRGLFVLVIDLAGSALLDDGRATPQPLEVCEPDAHAEVNRVALLEGQRVVGVGVGREPVLAVYLLAVGLEGGEALLELGHALAARLDDLVVAVVHPDAPLEVAALRLRLLERFEPLRVGEDFRRHVEDVSVELVQLLLA